MIYLHNMLKNLLALCLLGAPLTATAEGPAVILGSPESYCKTLCFVKIPFTITHFQSTQKMGLVLCDIEAEVRTRLPVHNGELRSKLMHASPTGVFRNSAGTFNGEVDMDTGIRKEHFVSALIKSARCHP